MSTCESCIGISFTDSDSYTFRNVGLDPGCPMCGFILRSLDYTPSENPDGQRNYIWEPSEHLVLYLNRRTNVVKVQIVGSDDVKLWLHLCSTYGVERSLKVELNAEQDDLPGRLIAAHADTRECYDLARGWLERCSKTHDAACRVPDDAPLPTRLIHIPPQVDQPLRIHPTTGMKGKYVALSYVWGRGSTFSTTKENLKSRQEEGIWPLDLPKTLRDSVDITRRLGYEWLWVDSLCILQGDFDDWTHESVLMADVYGNAVFTISADAAQDTDDGILHPRRLMTSPAFGPYDEFCFQKLEGRWESITEQHVYRRGWAFQERMLSKRVLHFLNDQLAFECNTTVYREGLHGRETHFELHFAKSMFTPFFHHSNPASLSSTALIAQIASWNAMIQELVFRDFTRPTDRLAGISGIANAMQSPALGAYFAGVWEANPFLSMFWYPRFPQAPSSEYRSPSWSWEWTRGQLMWPPGPASEHGRDSKAPIGVEDEEAWRNWNGRFAPELVERDVRLETTQAKGRVLVGTSMTVRGFCRDIQVEEVEGSGYNEWDYENNVSGTVVLLDRSVNECGFKGSFEWDEGAQGEGGGAKKYVCLQIVRDRCPWGVHKVHALMLEEDWRYEGAYRRVGVAVFDFSEADEKLWDKKTLKLV